MEATKAAIIVVVEGGLNTQFGNRAPDACLGGCCSLVVQRINDGVRLHHFYVILI